MPAQRTLVVVACIRRSTGLRTLNAQSTGSAHSTRASCHPHCGTAAAMVVVPFPYMPTFPVPANVDGFRAVAATSNHSVCSVSLCTLNRSGRRWIGATANSRESTLCARKSNVFFCFCWFCFHSNNGYYQNIILSVCIWQFTIFDRPQHTRKLVELVWCHHRKPLLLICTLHYSKFGK